MTESKTPAAATGPATSFRKSRSTFLSSTFADMHAERDYLRAHAFAVLEQQLRERGHHLETIDLRQGIETAGGLAEAERELKVLKVCLDEIERSRPFSVGFLGDRYGWVPPDERIEGATSRRRPARTCATPRAPGRSPTGACSRTSSKGARASWSSGPPAPIPCSSTSCPPRIQMQPEAWFLRESRARARAASSGTHTGVSARARASCCSRTRPASTRSRDVERMLRRWIGELAAFLELPSTRLHSGRDAGSRRANADRPRDAAAARRALRHAVRVSRQRSRPG